MTDEFSLIEKYFAPLSTQIGDDCALLELKPGELLATSVDTMVEGVHFYSDAPVDQIAYRAVVTALSDLAASGAEPRAITLALTLPMVDDVWMQQFSRGVQQALNDYNVELIGGDTTQGPLTITVQVLGAVPAGQALSRAGAQLGDKVYVSGTLGDAAAALTVINGQWPGPNQHKGYLLNRYYRPSARVDLGMQLRDIASSAIDVSDGLLADAGHVCERSGVGIVIDAARLPLSPALQSLSDMAQATAWALSGGDDYELLFTVPIANVDKVPTSCTCIGEVVAGSTVSCDFAITNPGYVHFSDRPSEGPPKSPSEGGGTLGGSVAGIDTPAKVLDPMLKHAARSGRPLRNFTHYLAFGFGSGLSPKAPGTMGTLVAIPLYLLMSELGLPIYTALTLLACLAGIWLCDKTSKDLKVHDHPGIVWDEFAGFWITMWALPTSWVTVLAGFVVFRFFDILKPWPISWLDKRVSGGWGIMVDDIVAGLFSCALLHGALRFGLLG